MERHGQVVKIRPGQAQRYIELHADVWPEVLGAIKRSNITNYSIFLRDDWLFTYFEYTGNAYESDMKMLLKDPVMLRWLELCDPCMQQLDGSPEGVYEMEMQSVFYLA